MRLSEPYHGHTALPYALVPCSGASKLHFRTNSRDDGLLQAAFVPLLRLKAKTAAVNMLTPPAPQSWPFLLRLRLTAAGRQTFEWACVCVPMCRFHLIFLMLRTNPEYKKTTLADHAVKQGLSSRPNLKHHSNSPHVKAQPTRKRAEHPSFLTCLCSTRPAACHGLAVRFRTAAREQSANTLPMG